LLRTLERCRQDLPRLGQAKHPRDENCRLGQVPFLHFPPTDIADVIEGSGGIDAVIMVYFFGLLGVNGPMPLEFTHFVFNRSYNQYDHTWRRFLDIIHHRMLTLFYRAQAVNEQAISFDRSEDDPVRDLVSAMAGRPPGDTGRRETLFLKNALHFGFQVKTRSGLEDILQRLFTGVKLEVEDFVTAVYDIPQESLALLGRRNASVLGVNLQIGRTYYSATGKFEIRIGPEDFSHCRDFLPGARGFCLLNSAVRLYLDRPLDYDIRLMVNTPSIPEAALGTATARLGGCWLGRQDAPYTTVVKSVSPKGSV